MSRRAERWARLADPVEMMRLLTRGGGVMSCQLTRRAARLGDRRLRLAACAIWRAHHDHWFGRPGYPDGEGHLAGLLDSVVRGERFALGLGPREPVGHWLALAGSAFEACLDSAEQAQPEPDAAHIAGLLRCVLGNPFLPEPARPVPRPEALAVAADVSARRAWGELGVLADALEDGGCDDAPLLAHLRSGGPHALGCWALDLVLGVS